MGKSLFEQAEAERDTIRDTINFLQKSLTSNLTTPLTEDEVDACLEHSAKAKTDVMANHGTLRNTAAKGVDMDPYATDYQNLLEKAFRIHAGFHGLKKKFVPTTAATPTPTSGPTTSTQQTIRLPRLELPKFDGNLQDWVSFRDLFVNAVHNSSLSNVDKLTQLKTLLTGEAARQIRSLVLSDANYTIAWQSLQDRYENNRELLFTILRRLFNQCQVPAANANAIRALIDTTKECVRSLDVLAIPTEHWDAVLIYLIFTKLDSTSRELWEQSLADTAIPALSKMYEFLEQRARALAAGSTSTTTRPHKPQEPKPHQRVMMHQVSSTKCKLGCDSPHPLFRCQLFRNKTSQQRLNTLKEFKLCFNCLSEGHSTSECSNPHTCRTCNRRHHTMVHIAPAAAASGYGRQYDSAQSRQNVESHYTAQQQQKKISTALLATAQVNIVSKTGGEIQSRVFLDGGSEVSLITIAMAKKLRLHLHNSNCQITGLASTEVGESTAVTSFIIKPRFPSTITIPVTALVVKEISKKMPKDKINSHNWSHLNNLQLADPQFAIPAPVDIMIGSDLFWGLLENETRKGKPGQPHAIKSSLGWLVAGQQPELPPTAISSFVTNADLDRSIQRFWECETIPPQPTLTEDDEAVEAHFHSTYSRNPAGRFTVSIPWKTPRPELGSSKQLATQRLLSLEKRLFQRAGVRDAEKIRKLSDQWETYKLFMTEYEEMGHMSLLTSEELKMPVNQTYYIPHHFVVKESSTTTKLRVVFDASMSTTSGNSLNDCMMVGPQLQDSLLDIMLRFRTNPIAFTADLEKMYRQILVKPEDAHFQRILWRTHPSLPIKEYKLNTVTYGTASAPYLAVKSLQQLAVLEKEKYPLAAEAALTSFYIDDNLSGSETLEEAKKTVSQLIDLCMSGGFSLRKWTTNDPDLLAFIPPELRETKSLVPLKHEDATVKTLGVFWNAAEDNYHFQLQLPPEMPGKYNKRIILSEISKIFDPCGWLSPAIIVCKIFMQGLWKLKCTWNEILPSEIQQHWISIKASLKGLEQIKIPRCVIISSPKRLIILGASDASIKAISACVYVHCEYDNQCSTTHLFASKTKVAPINFETLARLELKGAVVLSELLQTTTRAIKREISEVRAYTDSTIALHWINSNPSRWKTYVRNRVHQIQQNIPQATWFHLPGTSNPADCASRGISAEELLHHPLWWNASEGMKNTPTTAEHLPLSKEQEECLQKEIHPVEIHHAAVVPFPAFLEDFSSFNRLQRVVAWILRYYQNRARKQKGLSPFSGPLTTNILHEAHNFIIRTLQTNVFRAEVLALQKNVELPTKSKLLPLRPFLCSEGLLRVGGRLRNSSLPYNQKHGILLPRNHHITSIIMQDNHLRYLHAGPSSLLSILNQRYWVIRGKEAARWCVKKCTTCTRHKATTMKQLMGDLPLHRVNPSRPFSKVGIDYAGYFIIRPQVRSKVTLKCWLAIFVCLSTRAIHIEVVSSLSTDCFLAALRRFVSRRGVPSDIFSDCGTNFKKDSANRGIQWHFNPPGAPHFGGLWEAGVRSIKHHLTRVVGESLLTYKEMHTLVCQIEAILNSRPIIPASADPNDLSALTPGHFLVGSSLVSLPEKDHHDTKLNRLQRWELVQQRQQLFWKRWSNEFITRMQQRPKWCRTSENLKVGQMVIVKDERLPPLKWKLGRVLLVHPGADGQVRVATIKTADGEFKRPIVKLCLLPISDIETTS